LGAGFDHPATVDYPEHHAPVALGSDAPDPLEVGGQAQQAKSIEQDLEPADHLSFALATTVTEFLVAAPDILDLLEVAPKQGVVESQSSLRTPGSQTLGSKLKVAFQVDSASFSKMTQVGVVSL
jgi:hypothetical protein